jgi:hypothetical protein
MNNELTEREKAILFDYHNNVFIKTICENHRCSDRIIYRLSNENNVKRRNLLKEKMDEDEELKFYFLGLIASDGYMHKPKHRIELALHKVDEHIVELFCERFGVNINVRKNINMNRIIFANKEIFEEFESYGITQRKSETLNLNLNLMSHTQLRHFIRGYFDGDGSVYINNRSGFKMDGTEVPESKIRLHFSICGNENTMLKFQEYFKSVGVSVNYSYDMAKNVSYPFCVIRTSKTSELEKIYKLFYSNSNYFLTRKKKVFQEKIQEPLN